ncbi:MFS transporter [Flagellimonas hymeniacidonis]|uniref:MFS transporter n=1 Tax=Flagellimonas hymeniacidonis TaxID=2603628 RepID=A0A5C8V9K3_9FLAO|nr:MFS transporter [Flagellimonas hymeniacidonis]TXN38347.1 MFS transporter [Flagellimonas hymeniacidonis]
MKPPKHILSIIVIAQFFCTSLWFAGNGVMGDLVANFGLQSNALGHLTSAVQFGFITGTLLFAVFTLTDRYSPSKVFLVSALLGALCNVGVIWQSNTLGTILGLRFLTGFFLAGIYPVGMKIAADYFDKGLGKSLSYLVGALVVGTALPYLLKGFITIFSWQSVLLTTSILAVLGGILIVTLVPNGPYRKSSLNLDFTACFTIFKKPNFRAAAFGYFGHMWELYSFWAFVPVMLHAYALAHEDVALNISLLSFTIIALGGLACVIGGYASQKIGVKKTAATALLLSGVCCLISPLFFMVDSELVFVGFLIFWGMVVIADSPLFSTLVAQNAPVEIKGTALTIVNSIGFAITIVSIQLVTALQPEIQFNYLYAILALGPVLGLVGLLRK